MSWFGKRQNAGGVRGPGDVWTDWQAADEARDAARAGALAEEMVRLVPESFRAWFEAGLYAKARRDWVSSRERFRRADQLYGDRQFEEFDGDNPAAWNLGIAATALGDWSTARYAWSRYGVSGLGDGDGPIDGSFGIAPIRVNPDRPSLPHEVVLDLGATEVVWCRRLSPAHAVIVSVPLPESGHRFGDVLLHDGEPKGTRRHGDAEVDVFDEIERLHASDAGTWQVEVGNLGDGDVDALGDLAQRHEVGADDWSSIKLLCSDCSHGSPDPTHQHAPSSGDTMRMGLAGSEVGVARFLEEWSADRPHLAVREVELLW